MEQWEAIIEHPLEQGHRSFEKILETASTIINNAATHLAPFETEWMMETLLFAPVNVLGMVSEHRGDEVWRRAVADALKLLTSAVDAGIADQHCQHITDVCMLHYEPGLRASALACLAAAWRRAEGAGRHAARLVAALRDDSHCRAPLALLVGVLCEHHPAVVCDEVTNIWRGYLNMLDNKKNTDKVTKAVLEGIHGLLRHFGEELPAAELQRFYEAVSNVYIHKPACQPACFSILRDHAALFRERVSADLALRLLLRDCAPADTVLSVYSVTAQCVSKTTFHKILSTEVLPQTNSPSSQSRLTALRVLASSKTDCFGDLTQFVDVHTLEYELRREKVSREDADLVLWCVEYNLPNSDRLLQASIVFYENIPSAVRAQIVAKGILNSPPDVKRAAIQFLISRCCEDADVLVWRDLNDAEDDAAIKAVVRELAECLATALEAASEDEELPPKLSALLRLASKTSPAARSPLCACAASLLGLAARDPAVLAAARVVLAETSAQETHGFYKSIRIEQCRDEATLHEACLALIHAPDDVDIEPNNMLAALLIIFSSDAEPTVHSAALKKFDYLLTNDKCLDVDICETIRAVEKLRTKGDRSDKLIRILHREITLFLGKHGNVDINNNTDSLDDVVVDLKKSLVLSLPYQGTSCKVDLKTLLLLALQHEQPRALLTLLAMLCANLSSNKDLSTQRASLRVVRALASAHASGAHDYSAHIQHAVRLCSDAACGLDVLQYISSARSCGVRKLLSAALTTLCEDPATSQLAVERTNVMLAGSDSTTKRAGLDIAETILTTLENSNYLSKIILPELIVLIAKTYECDTKTIFDVASKTFIDKQELFDKEAIRRIIYELLENVLKTNVSDINIYKSTAKITIQFLNNLRDVNLDEILNMIFEININVDVKLLYVLAVLKSEFGFDTVMARRILGRDNSLLNCLLNLSEIKEVDAFKVESILRFVEEYCEVVLELKYKETIQFLSELIPKLTPALVKKLRNNIKTCFSTLHKHLKGTPKEIINSFQTWVEKLPIKKITDAIEKDCFLTEHKLCVESLKVMSNVFDIREIVSDVKMDIQRWPAILLKLYSSGRLEQYFYNEISYFIDIMMVGLKFLTPVEVKRIIKAPDLSKHNLGVLFCGFFIQAFFEVLTDRPFILLDEDLKECSVVLNDIVRVVVKKPLLKDRCEDVLELVDKLWPTYEQHSNFTQKHSLLTNLECLPVRLGPDSNPLQWARQFVCARDVSLDDRIRLLCLVPEDALKSPEVMSAVSCVFPARLRELRPALLDAVAARPAALLRLVASLADDATAGWWDATLESCLASVARRHDIDLCIDVYDRCHSERVCERMLVPLLRHSSTEVCEKFLATVLAKILDNLNKKSKGDTAHAGYEKCLDKYMISLHLLLIAFEKLPTWSIESPSSALYSAITASPWHLVREACRLVDALRETHCPTTFDDRLRTKYRKFQCMSYNCLSAGICRRRPGAALYARLFNDNALSKIVDENAQYTLPIRASWTQRNKALPVAVPLESTPLSLSHTQRSRIFLRTLSEHPNLFDLHSAQEDEVIEVQDITLRETPLNSHPCAATLTALFQHVAAVPALASLWQPIVDVLKHGHTNLKWLLSQIICNCKEELKSLASILLPGLLAVLSGTVDVTSKCMNGLHLDVFDTILLWREDTISPDLSTISHHLITTCMELRKKAVFDGLLKTLNGFLELYGSSIQIEWKSFEPYYEDKHHDTQKAILKLIKVISKNKIYVPQTLSKIASHFDLEPSSMSECFGLAMTACQDVGEKGEGLRVFKKYLEKCSGITSYVRVLYYASLGCAECCGEQEFRKITNYVTQVTSHDRTKCLNILSVYLSRGCRSEYIADMFELVDLADMISKDHKAMQLVQAGFSAMDEAPRRRCGARAAALRPAAPGARRLLLDLMLRACEELFAQPAQPPAKRQKTESTPILSVSRDDVYSNSILTSLGLAAVDTAADVAKPARDALAAMLHKDLGVRFAECFLLTLYLPAHTDKVLNVSVCVSALLEMLYSELRSAEIFRNSRLRDEPLPTREAETSRLLTLSRTFQGTFRSYGATRGRIQPQDTNNPAIDVQVTIDSIFETLLDFAKTTPEAARALLTESLRSVLATSKFDLSSALMPQLATLLRLPPGELTPVYLDVCRVLIESCSATHDLLASVEQLRTWTTGTEGASLTQLLYEEVRIMCLGETVFQLGQPDDIGDVTMDETTTFSIEDLKSALGKLSNWGDLTLQQRRTINNSLPSLWTDRRDFITHLDSYEVPADTQCWFDKMVAAFKQEMGPNSVRWLKKMDQWPRRQFEISAITEATSWRHEATETMPTHLFKTSDCLAEWAARLMIRSSYYNSLQHSESTGDRVNMLSRSHELQWCARANEMGIPRVALQCVDRNVEELLKSETLPWLRQKLIATRQIALERDNTTRLRDVLDRAKQYTPKYSTDEAVSIEMYHLMLLLHKDLKSLNYHELQTIMVQVNQSAQEVDWSRSSKKAVSSVYELAMAHYDESIDTGTMDMDSALCNMCHVFCQAANLDVPTADMLLSVLLTRLDEYQGQLGDQMGQQFLEKLSPLVPSLDAFTLELMENNSHKFPAHLQKSFTAILPKNANMEKYRRCLQLVCDPNHLLTHYCEELALALRGRDAARWKSTLDKMKDKIYDNPYAGPSFKLLHKYKADLYGIYEFEPTTEFTAQAEAKLKSIVMAVSKEPQTTLNLADLCPALVDHREETGVAKWFGLNHVTVVKFYDKVQVFTDSIRRPVILSMLLSNGRTHRAIQKTGEKLAGDAAAQHVAARVQRLCGNKGTAYTVTLLDEESALIEYLEGHERLRTLIASTCNLDAAASVSRPADGNLAESSTAALQAHGQLCSVIPASALRVSATSKPNFIKIGPAVERDLAESSAAALQAHGQLCSIIPASSLRSAVEQNSSCVQDFISKKQNFTDSLAEMTLLTWLLGLGDRHLQNILCARDGSVRGVDWGDVWRRDAEPPARLTRNLLHMTDTKVLEARLQRALHTWRDSALLLEACIRVAFRWMGAQLQDELQHVRGILRGVKSSYHVTRDVTSRGRLRHKDRHLQLLERVLADFRDGRDFSVEGQISCLLRHCTAPELLSVVRSGWEPWV